MNFLDISLIIFEHLPSFMKKMFHLLLKERVDEWLDNSVRIEKGKVKDVYLAGKLVGNENNPFPCIHILKECDNRLRDDFDIEKIFLRIYLNGAPLRAITWEKIENYYEKLKIKEVKTYPAEFKFEKDVKGYIHLNIFIPPYVSRDETIYISLYGYIVLKSSFGRFKKEIADSIQVDKEKWSRT
ncbi:MAG: hypothetical protein U9O85_08875 [Euryarchaeota archaeon]|nr:hypothetical protein [Euryarchaeota archaeon]